MNSPSVSHYTEPARSIPVLGEWDVVVCGGGAAGCAAAVAAARAGASVLMVERDSHLGGTTVSALVNVTLSTNGVDFQGIWHEWARKLRASGGISDLHWERRMGTRWIAGGSAPELVKLAWDELLTEAGVEILHFAWASSAIVESATIRGVVVEVKGGRQAVMARRVIDCTGDADVCASAGAGFELGVDGKPWTQGVSVNALLAGLPLREGYFPGTSPRSAGLMPQFQRGLIRFLKIDPLNPWDLTRTMREGRRMTAEMVEKRRAELGCAAPSGDRLFDGPYVAQTATLPGIRVSRRVRGVAKSDSADAFDLRKYPDGIARASWEIDFHEAEKASGKSFRYEGRVMDMESEDYKPRQRRTERGDWFDVRFGCLVARDIDHLLMAGRCVSCDVIAHSSLRIQQTCMAMGEAAGLGAALSIQQVCSPCDLDAVALAARLESERARITPAFPLEDIPEIARP